MEKIWRVARTLTAMRFTIVASYDKTTVEGGREMKKITSEPLLYS